MKVSRALISVSDKTGVAEFARALAELGVQILSTGGTAKLLEKEGVRVTEVSAHTGFPEMLDGRVKTLHPKIHGGILARRESREHMAAIDKAGIAPIDLIVVNLYPFEATVADPDCTLDNAVENIDIGGPAMLRAAAKNYAGVTVLVDPADYAAVLAQIRATGGVAAATRFALAKKVFAHTAGYDGAIANFLTALDDAGARREYPDVLNLQLFKRQGDALRRESAPVGGLLP
jgi:phosphoribosylaminoimidazolecarboxamide formyltransferase/IMP cyclohydrolase